MGSALGCVVFSQSFLQCPNSDVRPFAHLSVLGSMTSDQAKVLVRKHGRTRLWPVVRKQVESSRTRGTFQLSIHSSVGPAVCGCAYPADGQPAGAGSGLRTGRPRPTTGGWVAS
jgi:hypothetical protein